MQYLNVINPIITAILGFIIGLYTPIINWEIEKKRVKRDERKKFIKEVRDYFEKIDSFDRVKFADSMLYSRLKPYLSPKLTEEIEDTNIHTIHVITSGDITWIKTPVKDILKELRDLEKRWYLI